VTARVAVGVSVTGRRVAANVVGSRERLLM
jgi:hypothetical protein